MELHSEGLKDGEMMPDRFAFNVPDGDAPGAVRLGPNRNPDFTWSDLPEGTRSLALVCHDPDAPTSGHLVNVEGETVPEDDERVDFCHWLLVDIAPDSAGIVEGGFSDHVVVGGKDDLHAAQNTRQGLNDYTLWFEDDPDMEGKYVGYDGPAPPWNDARIHRYHFTLYALDVEEVEELALGYWFNYEELMDALDGHVLDAATLTGFYTLNPALR